MMYSLAIGVMGAAGRMGQLIVKAVTNAPRLHVAAALEQSFHPDMGRDIGTVCGLKELAVPIRDELPEERLAGIIDFSAPAGTLWVAKLCVEQRIPLLVATTGFSPAERAELEAVQEHIPLLIAANCSLVVNVLLKLASEAASAFRNKDFDVEIIERHHRYKVDSPSGTALKIAEVIESEMGLTRRVYGREGVLGQRAREELGIHAIRGGDNVGEHTVVFSALGETLELVHKSTSRESYARGALAGIEFLIEQPPGLYDMADVLGLK